MQKVIFDPNSIDQKEGDDCFFPFGSGIEIFHDFFVVC